MSESYRLELRGVTKAFPGVLANDHVSFAVRPGEIHALLGENGAGKSTLVKMIYGVLQPDAGEIRFDGQAVHIPNPRAARAMGIGMVFQHFSLFDAMTVLENIALGLDERLSQAELEKRIREVLARYGLSSTRTGRCRRCQRGRAAADRDRPGAAAEPEAADHGRADQRADAAGGDAAVRDAAEPGEERLLDPLHQPQAARDQGALRRGDDPARRQGGRRVRAGRGDLALDGRDDDRRQPEGHQEGRGTRRRARRSSWWRG